MTSSCYKSRTYSSLIFCYQILAPSKLSLSVKLKLVCFTVHLVLGLRFNFELQLPICIHPFSKPSFIHPLYDSKPLQSTLVRSYHQDPASHSTVSFSLLEFYSNPIFKTLPLRYNIFQILYAMHRAVTAVSLPFVYFYSFLFLFFPSV